MNHDKDIKAVIFDIDGTLYTNYVMLWKTPLLYIRNILWILRFAKMRKKLRAHLDVLPAEMSTKERLETFHKVGLSLFAKESKLPEDAAKYALQKHIYKLWINAVQYVPLRIGMRNLLGELRRKGIKLGILSDFQAREKIEAWGLSPYFDSVVCAEDLGILKPNLDIFHYTFSTLNIKPQETVFVGNHLMYDGIGASIAGMESLLFYMPHSIKDFSILSRNNITSFYSVLGLRQQLKLLGV